MDTSGVTPQQRYIFHKNLDKLPQEIQEDYAAAKANPHRGKQSALNAIMNSAVPKTMAQSYKDDITVDEALFTRYRSFSATKSQGSDPRCTRTLRSSV